MPGSKEELLQSEAASIQKPSWTSKIPWWIPHKRYVFETQEEIDEGYTLRIKKQNEKKKQSFHVKEFKDEANRKWYHFFNEFEYRYTKEELNRHDWWRWFDKGTSTAEKKLLTKLDVLITLVAFLGYWSKSLSQSNLNNAYVSGMKEDIGMKGNDLIDTQVLFSAANIIFEIPFIYTLPRINPTYMLFGAELFWSVFTLALTRVENPAALKGMRFLVGAGEGLFFPMYHYIFTNFYKPTEIQRRTGTYYFGLYLGTLTSGLLQSAIYNALNGVHGIEGWRYMFLIDGIISLTIAFITLFCVPGTPFNCYSIWLTDGEIKLARKRMRENGTDEKPPTTKQFFDPKVWKSIFNSWIFWVFTSANIGGFNSNSSSTGGFVLWLKSLNRYSIGKINNYSSIPPSLGIIYVIIVCHGSDVIRKRFLMITFAQTMNLIGNVILSIWNVPDGAKWFAFCFGYWSWSQSSVYYPLYNDLLRHDANRRSIEWTISYLIGSQSNVWLNKILYPTVEAPRFKKGYIGASAFSALQAIGMAIGLVFYKRDERKNAYKNGIIVYNSAKGEDPESALRDIRNRIAVENGHDSETIELSEDSVIEEVVETDDNQKRSYSNV